MSYSIRSMTLAVLVAVLAAPTARGQGKPAPEDQRDLKVGAVAPKFTLKDQEGKERSLDEFLEQGNVALVFFRSAAW